MPAKSQENVKEGNTFWNSLDPQLLSFRFDDFINRINKITNCVHTCKYFQSRIEYFPKSNRTELNRQVSPNYSVLSDSKNQESNDVIYKVSLTCFTEECIDHHVKAWSENWDKN